MPSVSRQTLPDGIFTVVESEAPSPMTVEINKAGSHDPVASINDQRVVKRLRHRHIPDRDHGDSLTFDQYLKIVENPRGIKPTERA